MDPGRGEHPVDLQPRPSARRPVVIAGLALAASISMLGLAALWLSAPRTPSAESRVPIRPDLTPRPWDDPEPGSESTAPAVTSPSPTDPSPFRFADVTDRSGIDFAYRNGEEAGLRTILESLGGGVALFDFDGDGRLDLFATGGGGFETLDAPAPDGARFRIRGRSNRLFRNEGGWHFRDVTATAGLDGTSYYGHGAAAADIDNDGDLDLVVTSYQGTHLYRNEAGRRFTDVTTPSGLDQPGWATSVAWADFDRDGKVDLYVTRYVDWSPTNHPPCRYRYSGEVDVCSPSVFKGLNDALYHNEGGGRFREIGKAAGLVEGGKGLGVVAADLDGDRDVDVYVANDTSGNHLYRNRGDGRFDEIAFASGSGVSAEGIVTGSMGADAADADGDGDLDLWVSNYEGETNELYLNEGSLTFTPMGMALGLGAVSRPMVGWGTGLIDLDNDGRLDAFVADGHLMHHLPRSPLAQRPLLFHQERDGRFREVGPGSGPYFAGLRTARGCAWGDLDNDGDLDLVVIHQNQPLALLRNETESVGPVLRLRLEGAAGRPSPIGARVRVAVEDRVLLRTINGSGSYLSQADPRLFVGLGAAKAAERVEVDWPSGATDVHRSLPADRPWLIQEGHAPVEDPRCPRP